MKFVQERWSSQKSNIRLGLTTKHNKTQQKTKNKKQKKKQKTKNKKQKTKHNKTQQNTTKHKKRLRHRGPDWNGIKVVGQNILCHERLAIVGVGNYSFLQFL